MAARLTLSSRGVSVCFDLWTARPPFSTWMFRQNLRHMPLAPSLEEFILDLIALVEHIDIEPLHPLLK